MSIVDKHENIEHYALEYAGILELVKAISTIDIHAFGNGKRELTDNISGVGITAMQPTEFSEQLEVHEKWIDIHYILSGTDLIKLKPLDQCLVNSKQYDPENDYALYDDPFSEVIQLNAGHFCLIDTDMAHMALTGEGEVKKIVFKLRK